MRSVVIIVLTAHIFLLSGRLLVGDQPAAEDELTKLKHEYADVLALQGTSKGEILAIARILRANPEVAIDRTAASGEYCFNSGQVPWFTSLPSRSARKKTFSTSSTPLD